LEAGGSDEVPDIIDASAWPRLRGSEHDWSFKARANPRLNGRDIPMSMGRVLGGGSGINVMMWSRGHRNDWDRLANEVGDSAWDYDSVLRIYRRIEDWHGEPDAVRRGTGGPVFVQPAPNPHPLALAMLEAFAAAGVPTFADQNGIMMEGDGGGAITNLCVRDGRRQSIFRAYVHPLRRWSRALCWKATRRMALSSCGTACRIVSARAVRWCYRWVRSTPRSC
jgi:choline dehydrogenase